MTALCRLIFWVALVGWLGGAGSGFAAAQTPLPFLPFESKPIPLPDAGALGSPPAQEAGDYLRRGQLLEQEGRWADAVLFYEEAIRRFPRDGTLLHRYQHSRLRVDVTRRWRDGSFLGVVDSLNLTQAAEALHEALLKVQVHYVEPVGWPQLTQTTLRELTHTLSHGQLWERYGRRFSPEAWQAVALQWERLVSARSPADRYQAGLVFAEAARLAEAQTGLPAPAVLLEAMCTVSNLLDIYSCYLTPQQLREILSQIEGNFVGLGVELRGEEGGLTIVRVIPGSPAAAAGLRPGDRILAVGDQPTASLPPETAADLLQGPEGSLVRVTVGSPGQAPREIWIRRAHVDVPSVEGARLVDPAAGVAYFRITAFQKSTPKEVDTALWSLYYQGMRSLIVDLRGNPGGLLGSAVEVADRFLDRGVIVYTRGRNVIEDCTYVAHAEGTWRVPLVVLIDGQSASAAEIFAAAMRDHRRGTLVGTPSYGKGSVQGIFPLSSHPGGLRLTTSRFYSPAGRPFTLEGVVPEVLLRQAARPVGPSAEPLPPEEDYALSVAIQTARELVARRPSN